MRRRIAAKADEKPPVAIQPNRLAIEPDQRGAQRCDAEHQPALHGMTFGAELMHVGRGMRDSPRRTRARQR